MQRRSLLTSAGMFAFGATLTEPAAAAMSGQAQFRRVRPSDPAWPSTASWETLNRSVGGNLFKVQPLLAACVNPDSPECHEVLKAVKNPYYVGDQPAGTQTAGWLDAWMSAPSVYAVAARSTEDVVAAVNFARENRLRLVVKGGGHSYQGTSDSADSLLLWTRAMNSIALHDAFVAEGCQGKQAPQPAVTVGAGCVWMNVYDAVTTKAERYVQGGGCATVGVAGLIQSGGFGSFSKNFGAAAGGLLEAEVVTADGQVRIASACTNPDLFWGIKGGGGGSLGIVTRLTLRTRELPAVFGGASVTIKAASDAAFRRLIARFVGFYAESLLNPHWGESVTFGSDKTFAVSMVFQGLEPQQAVAVWRPFLDWIAASPRDFTITVPPDIGGGPARNHWNAAFLKKSRPGRAFFDQRPGAPADNVWFAEQNNELGIFIHGYQSLWLPASLLQKNRQKRFVDALFAATRHYAVMLHFNKGLAGTNDADVSAAKDTAMNPAVLDAFALAIIAGGDPAAYTDLLGHPRDLAKARADAAAIGRAADALRKVVPNAGSYVSESNYFERGWQRSFWGSNYPRLLAVKQKYDPEGLFFVHHGVGSENWSADGFTRIVT
ncbi:MAG: FAD-binding oxidoreductase [Acetobacteraceae bacterium]